MDAPELLALSLGLSVVVAALAWAGGRLVERLSADPRLRDRVWAAALILPSLPPLAVGLMLLTPAPVREIAPPPVGPSADFAMPAFEFAAVAPSAGPVIDPTLAAWAVLGVTILLAVVRLAALALRARRLLRLIGQAQVPGPGVTAMVEDAARDLAIRPPLVRVSATAPEALLASLGRAQLILPAGLTAPSADPAAARAAITHELSHLKRGDHRALWLEETLLALLAINPLMPTLRARRAAAREEACDALALAGAAPEARRAYARSLIEALRSRAAPQGSGGLPALTFTGAGRTTAMRRLKAVLSPAPAAGRGPRLMAVGLAGLIAALTGAGSLAVAGEREAVIRIGAGPSAAGSEAAAGRMERPGPAPVTARLEQSRTVDLGPDTRILLNGAPLPDGLPMWAVAAERADFRTGEAGAREVNLFLDFTGTVPVSVDGRRMPTGFPVSGVSPEAVARVETIGDHVKYTLKPEAEVRRERQNASRERSAARLANQPSETTLSPEQQARYRNPTAREYQALCASSDPGDDAFCAGVLFSQMQGRGLCLPTELDRGAETVRRAALGDLVARGKAEVARASIRAGDRPGDIAREALARAYPCETAQEATLRPAAERPELVMADFVPLTVTADIEGRPLSVRGDETLRVVLTDENGAVMNTHGTINGGSGRASGPLGPLGMAIAADDFPSPGASTRTYTLTGEIRGPGRELRYVAEPVTLRLGPGARRLDLRPTLSFRPVAAPARPGESDFLAAQRADREATREAWPAERGLRLPNWPRPERPARGSPFYNERRAADPQNSGVPRT